VSLARTAAGKLAQAPREFARAPGKFAKSSRMRALRMLWAASRGWSIAATDPDLILLRRVTFRPVVTALRRIGLCDGLKDAFCGLNLLPQ
jgi:hypothetical protein